MIVHQMICGETPEKGYGLLSSTLQDKNIAKSIAFKTGLPDIIGDVKWQPTIRGFLFQNYFLIIKNFPDLSDGVRAGRVFSHVLLIAEKDIHSLKDIGNLQPFFLSHVDKSILKKPFEINLSSKKKNRQDSNLSNRFTKVINAFTLLDKFKNTIVWVGEMNFEDAVFKFWELLSLDEKKRFYFGIHFGTDSIKKDKINFITTPENIESKFNHSNFCIVREHDKVELTSLQEQLLAKNEDAKKRISLFEETIESTPILRKQISKVAIILDTFENFKTITDFKKLNTLAHVVAEFSPEKLKGKKFKEQLIHKMGEMIVKGNVELLPFLKTFKIKSFKNSKTALSQSIQKWMDKNLFSFSLSKKNNYSILFSKLEETKVANWWTILINEHISNFLNILTDKKVAVIFNWINFDTTVLQKIKSYIRSSNDVEFFFTNQLSKKITKASFEQLIQLALERNWFSFHAKLLSFNFNNSVALEKQISVDTNNQSIKGILIITSSMAPKSLINFAVKNGDIRLLNIASETCNNNKLLDDIDFTNKNWQKVWLNFIKKGNKLTQGFKKPKEKIFSLFDAIITNVSIDKNILNKIADSDFANILNYSKREQLWEKLPYSIKQGFLKKTSTVFLESLSKDSSIDIPDDKILSDYITSGKAISDFLYFNSQNLKTVLPIFKTFDKITDSNIKDYLSNYKGEINAVEAVQLGKIVSKEAYKKSAIQIYNNAKQRESWRKALSECYELLSSLKQIKIFVWGWVNKKFTKKEWWKSVTEVIIDLYPNINSLTTLWKNAGGKESDLLTYSSSENIWKDAISKLHRNKFDEITMKTLLDEINKKYGDNDSFKFIYDLKTKFI